MQSKEKAMRSMIDMAREAGMTGLEAGGLFDNFLVFEALVRADERDRAMRENAYVQAEREACAKVCEEYADDVRTGVTCAKAIRARGNT
jgi:hypothetical protein